MSVIIGLAAGAAAIHLLGYAIYLQGIYTGGAYLILLGILTIANARRSAAAQIAVGGMIAAMRRAA